MKRYLYEDLYNLEEKHWWHVSKRTIVQNLIENYNNIEKPKILDIGCGTGKNIEELSKYGEVWGLDKSLEAIKFCKKRGLKNLKLGNAEKTKFKSGSFDIITLLDVLEHTDDNQTLQEMNRLLKKNGLLIITVPAFYWLWSQWDRILHHKRRYNSKNLIAILQKNKFKIIKITYLYSFLVPPALTIRKIKEKIFNKKQYPSDFQLSNIILNKILGFLASIEFKLTQKLFIPVGTTLLVVARNEK